MKKRLFALTLILSLTTAVSCTPKQAQQPIKGVESSLFQLGDISNIRVLADKVNIRSGCSQNAPVLQTTNKDNTLNVVSQVADWYAVKLPDNNIGFVPKSQCKPIVVDEAKPDVTPKPSDDIPQPSVGNNEGATTPKIPTSNNNATSLTSEEQEMLRLVNEARSQNNVPPLQLDMNVCNVARVKAQDMIDNNYFSHYSPTYGSPFDMMKSFGIKFIQAGENIAGNQTVQNAHNTLMNSPGHRKNLLNPDYTHIGIGIKKGGPYGNMFSQMFISRPK